MSPFSVITLVSFLVCLIAVGIALNLRLRTSVHHWLAGFGIAMSAVIFVEFELSRSATPAEASEWIAFTPAWFFFIATGLYLALSFLDPPKRRLTFVLHGLVATPPIVFSIAHHVVQSCFEPPVRSDNGFVFTFAFAHNPFGRAASVWCDLTWIVAVSIPLYMFLTAKTATVRRQTLGATGAFTLLFSHYAFARTHPDIILESPVPFSAIGVIALLLLLFVAFRFQYALLTPAMTVRNMMVAMSDAVLLAGPDTRIRDYNDAAAALVGDDGDGLRGRPLADLVTHEHRLPIWSRESSADPLPPVPLFEAVLMTSESERLPVLVSDARVTSQAGDTLGYVAIVRDIADQKNKSSELTEQREYLEHIVERRTDELNTANESLIRSRLILRNLSERLFEAKEKESARIARELHDELGQILTGLKIDVTLLRRKIRKPNHLALIDDVSALTDTTIKRVQSLTKELRPPMLEKLGLVATVETMVADFNRRHQIACRFTHDMGTENLSTSLLTSVYRILQETLDNIIKHARASAVDIRISTTSERLDIAVADDGIGIDEARAGAFESLGILGMKERAISLGGEVRIGRNSPRGTRVHIYLPIQHTTDSGPGTT